MGVEVRIEGLTKSFGRQNIWADVSFTLPSGEISVLLGPSGTGKSVFLKTLVGLLKPERGGIWIHDRDLTRLPERELYKVRRLFGVLFQDGALFGSMSLFDNIAFPLREHTRKSERDIKALVGEKMEMVGLLGAERKLPGEISGGMRKRAGLARALVLDPEIVLFDEPDSGLDPVRTAYLNQLIVDLNQQTGATFLIVTHDINTARTVPDNVGLLYRRHLAMFGPREMLLSSQEPVVRQFLNAQRQGPIGMAEEKDASELEAEAAAGARPPSLPPIPMQLPPTDGRPRPSQRPPGEWLLAHGIEPPPGSFAADPTRIPAWAPMARAAPARLAGAGPAGAGPASTELGAGPVGTGPGGPGPGSGAGLGAGPGTGPGSGSGAGRAGPGIAGPERLAETAAPGGLAPALPRRGIDEDTTVELPRLPRTPRALARQRAAQERAALEEGK